MYCRCENFEYQYFKSLRNYRRTAATLKKTVSKIVDDEKRNLWNKSSSSNNSQLKAFKSFSAFDEAEVNVKTKRWKNDSSNANQTKTSSTLSLHIAAYENFIEGGDTVSMDKKEDLEKDLGKEQKQISINSALIPFEFPRQQTDDKPNPAVMHFTASQQLLKPNQSKPSDNIQQGTQDVAGQRTGLIHSNQRPSPFSAQNMDSENYIKGDTSKGKVPSQYLSSLIIKKKQAEGGGGGGVASLFGERTVLSKPSRLKITDTFNLPANSSHASTGKHVATHNGVFSVIGREVRKVTPKPVPRKATIVDDSISLLREMYQDPGPIDAKCSQKADNMQEPRPIGDDCPEAESCLAGSLLANLGNEVVPSSQKDDDYLYQNDGISYEPILKNEVVPSSQPDDDYTIAELEQLLTSSNTPSSSSKGQIQIIDDTERHALFAPRPSPRRILRSHNTLVPYQTTPTKQSIKRSYEQQDESDFIVDSPANRKTKRTSTSNRSTPVPKNIPDLPDDFEMLLENVNFQTKGRKQCDETFGEMSIKGYDLYSLRTRQYVNDLIIDKYMELVCSRSTDSGNNYRKSFAFGTFFYTMLNNGQDPNKLVSWIKEDLFDYELLFLPINQENHWYLFVADTVNRNHFVYDSLYYGGNDTEIDQIVDFLKFYAKKKNHDIDWDDWSKNPVEEQIGPKQTNGVDCGIFLCQYAEHLSRRANLDFTQSGMVNYRKIMLYELIKGQLTPRLNKEEKAIEQNDA